MSVAYGSVLLNQRKVVKMPTFEVTCLHYEICGSTETFYTQEEFDLYGDDYTCAECYDQLEMFLSELNHVAEKISVKIQEEVDSSAQAEEPEPSDDTKTPKVQERLKNKLRKKIKEIIRTHLMSSR